MKLLRLGGMECIPWWARMWRYDPLTNYRYILPLPFCWPARLLWNLWCLTYKFRPNWLEAELTKAYRVGHQAGYQDGWRGNEAVETVKEIYVEEA